MIRSEISLIATPSPPLSFKKTGPAGWPR